MFHLHSLKDELALLTTRMMQQLDRLKGQEGPAYDATWAELRACVLDKGKVAAKEWKRVMDTNALLTVEQTMLFTEALLTAAREVVKDRETLWRLQQRVIQLLPPPEEW